MCSSDRFPVAADDHGTIRLSPTDISQFIRLEQCERYLRLRLHERTVNAAFMRDYGVTPQSIPPLLTRSGATFEEQIVHTVASHYRTISFVAERTQDQRRANDNDHVLSTVHDLQPSETVVLFQPRVQVQINGWLLRGDVDLLRVARDATGTLQVLVADIKSSTSGKIEHRLQVAFYREMLATLLQEAGRPDVRIDIAILYRGPAGDQPAPTHLDANQLAEQRDAAERYFGTRDGFLDIVADPDSYRGAVEDLVTGSDSTARRVVTAHFESIPYHLTYKCDGCLYNEFCMKWSAEQDDLSLLPHLTDHDKHALHRAGIMTVHALATLKEFRSPGSDELVPAAGQTALVQQLSATWPVGPRLDELVHRARRYHAWKGGPLESRP